MGTAVIVALDALRSLGLAIPFTFFEPLYFSFVTGMAVSHLARQTPRKPHTSREPAGWFWLVLGLSVAACAWWYWEGTRAYEDFLLGYHDFGHFARRIINTWEGRGWLLESPGVPAFWDHFNPGLVLLAPLWAVWPDARLFIGLQAVCLASPALLAFGIERRYDCDGPTSAFWSAVYLAFPSVGLLNLSYSYGWHPVSVAVPLLFLAAWAWLHGWRFGALVAAVLACSFQESVIVVLGCLAAALALQGWLIRGRSRGGWRAFWARRVGQSRLAQRLPVWGWLTVWAALVLAFLLIARYAPFMQFQTTRFASLGDSPIAVALSPVLRPTVFWGQMSRNASIYFLLGLLVPWHLPSMLRGWPLLLALVLPMTVLLAWEHGPATSIAFQYVSESLIILYLAALSGSGGLPSRAADEPDRPPQADARRSGGLAALAASLTAASLFGSLPLKSVLAEIDRPDASVVATGRIAAHLLRVRRLESAEQALVRWDLLAREMGPARNPIEAFDWVVLDRYEQFQQSSDRTLILLDAARDAGYHTSRDEDGLIVLRRPDAERGD